MARIRTIKPEFWTDEKIISIPHVARLFFIGLWNFADDAGAIQDKPEQLKLLIMPSESDVDVFQILDLLIASGLIDRYIDMEKDESYLLIRNWGLHQKVDKPTPSKIITASAKRVNIPQQLRRDVAVKYGCSPGENKEVECYLCGAPGTISWGKKDDGSKSGWVSFTHELAYVETDQGEGDTSANNLVLECRSCNRAAGVKNAFAWVFNKNISVNNFRVPFRKLEIAASGNKMTGNNNNAGERSEKIDKSPPHSPEEISAFEKFQHWILANAPTVAKMKEPFTIAQFLKVKTKISAEETQELLKAMHNRRDLLQKNRSAYLTLTKWKKLNDDRKLKTLNEPAIDTEQYREKRQQQEERARRLSQG